MCSLYNPKFPSDKKGILSTIVYDSDRSKIIYKTNQTSNKVTTLFCIAKLAESSFICWAFEGKRVYYVNLSQGDDDNDFVDGKNKLLISNKFSRKTIKYPSFDEDCDFSHGEYLMAITDEKFGFLFSGLFYKFKRLGFKIIEKTFKFCKFGFHPNKQQIVYKYFPPNPIPPITYKFYNNFFHSERPTPKELFVCWDRHYSNCDNNRFLMVTLQEIINMNNLIILLFDFETLNIYMNNIKTEDPPLIKLFDFEVDDNEQENNGEQLIKCVTLMTEFKENFLLKTILKFCGKLTLDN